MAEQRQYRQRDRGNSADPAEAIPVPEVIAQNMDWVMQHWLERVNADPELTRVKLSNSERKDHLPGLLEEAIARACHHDVDMEERQNAAERHGTLRYHEGYSVDMLLLEAQLLQDVVAECIKEKAHIFDIKRLISDMAKVNNTIAIELRASVIAYMDQCEWHGFDPGKRPLSGN